MNLNDIKTEIKTRLTAGNKCYHALGHILKKRYISQSIKVRLYKTVIRPTVAYGAETWTLTEKMGKLLLTWERKVLRKICGPTKENGCWRIKMNHEIREKFKSPDIISVMKLRRLEWLGHVMRMNETRVARKILDDKPGGKRRRGRPRLRWLDDVEADLRSMGVERWRTKVLNREEWVSIIKEAKARLKGL
jgi:hypothetical protein